MRDLREPSHSRLSSHRVIQIFRPVTSGQVDRVRAPLIQQGSGNKSNQSLRGISAHMGSRRGAAAAEDLPPYM